MRFQLVMRSQTEDNEVDGKESDGAPENPLAGCKTEKIPDLFKGKSILSAIVVIVGVIGIILIFPVKSEPFIRTQPINQVREFFGEAYLALPVMAAETTKAEPYHFYSLRQVTVIPSVRYDVDLVREFIFGQGYRTLWTTPVSVPVIDLNRTADGLTVLEKGGGTQTKSLHLKGGDGHFYRLRSVDKDPSPLLPRLLRNTTVAYLLRDMMAAINPYGALAVPTLAEAAGILHTQPTLVVIPDSPLLGEFRSEFAGMLALFERKPDEDQSETPRFGYSENVIGTEKLFEELAEEDEDFVDQRAYAKARLFDMWIGDWDRGAPQWRWAEYEGVNGSRYVAVPIDRDYAFSRFDGLVHRLGRFLGIPELGKFGAFDDDFDDLAGLNRQSIGIDCRFTTDLARTDLIEIADSLQEALTDSVIVNAFDVWPASAFEAFGTETINILKERREQLPAVADWYGRYLTQICEHASTRREPELDS